VRSEGRHFSRPASGAVPTAMIKRSSWSFLLCALLAAQVACTDCQDDRVRQRSEGAVLIAEVRERVCGSASGLTVRVFPRGTPERAGDAYDFEPFQSRCPASSLHDLGVWVAWKGPKELEVQYSAGLTVTRAEVAWNGISISYTPVDTHIDRAQSPAR
jgi:hypothetical protein